jgi:adenylate kinase family enzyme
MGCDSASSIPVDESKPSVIFVIGGPGCGKGTQCKRIVSNFNYTSFSSGDLLRKYVEDKKEGYEEISNKMKEGQLISSETVMKVLKSYIINSENKKILLDGYPRNKENMDIWEREMKGQVNVLGALYFDVTNEEMEKRILGRNEGRADDNVETIKKRLATFERETKPILDLFEKRKILIRIDGMKSVDEISEDVSTQFKKRRLDYPGMPNVVFVIGGPGCGKGTQCKRIVANFGYVSFSTGDLLRKYVQEQKEGYEDIQNKMKEGQLISSETVMKVQKSYIINSKNKKILLDGYPRNKENMDIWDKEMKGQAVVRAALYFDVSNEEMKKRILGRNEGRADDNEETITKRLATFEKETKPILEEFEKQKILIKIDGMKSVDEISNEVNKQFNAHGLN